MSIVTVIFSGIFGAIHTLWFIFINGGWLALVGLAGYFLYLLYRTEITDQFLKSQEWMFLNIRVPRENLASTLAIEQIYAQMHALHSGLTFAHKYIEGRTQLWYALELVSLGGMVSFIIRTPKKVRDLVESAFYSQYPQAEISEVSDYLENVSYNADNSELDIWGTELKLTDDQAIPLKTYREFEHPTAEDKIIDPINPIIEGLNKLEPYEFFGVQFVTTPLGDDEWKPAGETKAKELLGEKSASPTKWTDIFWAPLKAFANINFFALLTPPKQEEKKEKTFQSFSEIEKDRINGIHRKISKPGYITVVRLMYMAPKDKFNAGKVAIIMGAFRNLGSAMSNKFRLDSLTKTGVEYKISPTLEGPYLNYKLAKKKNNLFAAYKGRYPSVTNKYVLNTEELATLYHLPISIGNSMPPVDRVELKKAQPPSNLPVGE